MLSDEELVQAMSRGDQAAFEAFVHRYHSPIQGYLERMLRDSRRAEDFAQETFYRLIRNLRNGNVPDQIKPWMYRVATNLCKDYWKGSGYKHQQSMAEEAGDRPDERPSVVDLYERQETRKELLALLDELSDVQKEIIVLRFYQDLKLQDIAETLELSLSGVKTHLYNSLRKLKKKLESGDARRKEDSRYGRP